MMCDAKPFRWIAYQSELLENPPAIGGPSPLSNRFCVLDSTVKMLCTAIGQARIGTGAD